MKRREGRGRPGVHVRKSRILRNKLRTTERTAERVGRFRNSLIL